MQTLINLDDVNTKIITIRNQNVILDSAVAELYCVNTDDVNQAVKRNLDKFPEGYVFELSPSEKQEVIKNLESLNTDAVFGVTTNCGNPKQTPSMAYLQKIKNSPRSPKAFTEKGLYMLATILKSPQATQTTIAIVEAFTKIRELSRAVVELAEAPDDEEKQLTIMQKSGAILSDIIKNDLKTTSTETSFELNLLAMLKLKHTIKRETD